jgi:hypothetical protein
MLPDHAFQHDPKCENFTPEYELTILAERYLRSRQAIAAIKLGTDWNAYAPIESIAEIRERLAKSTKHRLGTLRPDL